MRATNGSTSPLAKASNATLRASTLTPSRVPRLAPDVGRSTAHALALQGLAESEGLQGARAGRH